MNVPALAELLEEIRRGTVRVDVVRMLDVIEDPEAHPITRGLRGAERAEVVELARQLLESAAVCIRREGDALLDDKTFARLERYERSRRNR